ncbi:Stp1/IreP family PP2C-type Ser/Thr phosphatase [Paenibacillus aurantius]|uniref:Stp1/IreP family PP2C-type Ser/Thr phosphatase n=1 Tax=Paenibacillus aurantius TaxID=2918900 RepID=A0AA96LGU3_9BACL|nr:Stp1/IreP family PP2C-type Ser/Thr phosphatase [Paenibacillus aurantius]WNQ13672.1 Stp1/IreP family PP2C-type Ser/Thr phosphatase [Paenibacillus aurantius]
MITASRTDVGRVRPVNEDRAYAQSDLNGFALALVADGMGGHQAGDIASQMTIDLMREGMEGLHSGMTPEERAELIRYAVLATNRKVFEFADGRDQFQGMGTTLLVAVADPARVTLGHVGDSRAYLCRSGRMVQLTEDHTLVNALIKSGQITPEEAEHHPRRNMIIRALGTEATLEVDILHHEWAEGDILLLCSDGLSGLVNDRRISDILNGAGSLKEKADQLIHSALEAGGDDNITAVLVSNEPGDSDKKR